MERQPKVVRHEHFFRVNLRRLERLFAGDQPKAEGSLESHFFGSSQRVTWGASRSVGRRQPKVVRHEHFFGVHLRTLERLFAQYKSKAEGCPEPYFFELSQRAAWGASRSVWKGSRKRTSAKTFQVYLPMIFVISCYLFPAYFTLSFSIHFIQTLTES